MRRARFRVGAGSLAVVATLLLVGCTPSAASDGTDLITVNGSEPTYPLIPANTDEPGGNRILDAIFAGLVFYQEGSEVVEDLADSIVPNADNTVYTITIDEGTTFTNGQEVTSDSFVDAWVWAAMAENETLNRRYFADIVGYSEEEDVSLEEAGGLVVLDDQTFEVHLTSPVSDFVQRLGHIAFAPLPEVFFEDPAAFGADPIGNGPYMLDGADAWQHDERIELVVNPEYEGERQPENDGLTMLFYESLETAYADLLAGALDVLDTIPDNARPTFKEELGRLWIDQPVTTLETLRIPVGLPHFTGAEGALRREALSQAIDRAGIAEDVFGGTRIAADDFASPALHRFPQTLRGADLLGFSPDAAKEKWVKADETAPWEGTFEIAYNADGGHGPWVDAVAESIHDVLGIDAVGVPYPTLADLKTAIADKEFASAYRVGWRADYPGVVNFIVPLYATKGAANDGRYSSAAFDAQLKLAAAAPTLDDAAEAYRDAQEILLSELPGFPLWNTTVQAGYSDRVDDVGLDWHGVPFYHQITTRDG
jgi:oligopeptide transport system substrate-binding protein